LEELNLASTSIPIETVTKLLTNVSEDLNLDLDLKNNNLGSVGAVEIAKIAYRINSVHSLDLSDNDLGDEGLAELALGLRNNNSIRRLYLNRNFKMGKSKDRARAVDTLIQLVSSDCLIEGTFQFLLVIFLLIDVYGPL
jgi:Ran GTPase-activating protein (RanGAP) involved in mRNA processing and transport